MTEAQQEPDSKHPDLDQPKEEATASIRKFSKIDASTEDSSTYASLAHQRLPRPSKRRQSESLSERPFDLESPSNSPLQELGGDPKAPNTVFYLAYGSNLCRETFQGRRGIKPLSAVNVVVPELVMTFDLAGIPYAEPCFANTRYRIPQPTITPTSTTIPPTQIDEKLPEHLSSTIPLLDSPPPPPSPQTKKYHNPYWPKGLVGVVYEVTLPDFAHIIATEGGGASYQDVLVTCHELPPGTSTVPAHPTTSPFKAHTLYSPSTPYNSSSPQRKSQTRQSRPDPDYAQPSARYLNLLTSGAAEHALPPDYTAYLHALQPYTITTTRQRIGAAIFTAIWLPVIGAVFRLNRRFADKRGKAPGWLVRMTGAVFASVWVSYDYFFKWIFGDGERTVDDGREGVDEGVVDGKAVGVWEKGRAGLRDEDEVSSVDRT